MPKLIMPGQRAEQKLNLTMSREGVILQLEIPCKEIVMDPQSAAHLAKSLALAASDCYNKYYRANDYSLENDKDIAKILGKKQ